LLSPGAQLAVLKREVRVDPAHAWFIQNFINSESVVWDIGGNIGMFAFPAALRARSVIAFEPDVDLCSNLLRSISMNPKLDVLAIPVAVSDQDAFAQFLIARQGRSMNKLEGMSPWHSATFETASRRIVPTYKVDTLVRFFPPPTVIKIDVEGAEMKVLRGAETTLRQQRSAVFAEGPQELSEEMQSFFASLDYVLYDGATGKRVESPTWNTVAVPA
jgi:FkbM family methyltransferase